MKAIVFLLVYLGQFVAAPIYLYVVGEEVFKPVLPTLVIIGFWLISIVLYEIDAARNYRGSYRVLFLVLLFVFHVVVAPYYWFTHILRQPAKS